DRDRDRCTDAYRGANELARHVAEATLQVLRNDEGAAHDNRALTSSAIRRATSPGSSPSDSARSLLAGTNIRRTRYAGGPAAASSRPAISFSFARLIARRAAYRGSLIPVSSVGTARA